MRDSNQEAFSEPETVASYARRDELQPPERTILEIVAPRLAGARMLDLAVGAGRTTVHFQPRVAEYVAIDYAQAMVDACRWRLPELAPCFHTGDLRDLSPWSAGGYDFVLISFNGIDYVTHEERAHVLRQVRGVCRPGARFAFSTHNLNAFWPWVVRPPESLRPRALLDHVVERVQIFRHNDLALFRTLVRVDHAIMSDGHAAAYGIRARAQVAALAEAGFTNVRIFGLDGVERTVAEAQTAHDSWLYYLGDVA